MNLSEQETTELSELTQAYHEGTLTASQGERLEALILRNPEACAEFVQRSAIVTDLQWQLGAVNANSFPLRPPVADREAADSASGANIAAPLPVESESQTDAHGIAGGLPITPSAGHSLSQNIKQHPLLYLAAAIVLATSLWSASGLLSSRGNPEVIGSSDVPGLTRSVARLTRTMDAQWGVGMINDGAFLRSGQRMELVTGLAEVTYKNGAVVLLEAPVSFLLNDRDAEHQPNRALKNCDGYLESGRISVRVSKPAQGFTVQTAAATITDMGAEFGLAVSNDDAVSLVVFSGSAEIAVAERYGNWRQRVDAGNSLRFDPSEVSPVPQSVEDAGPFVRKLPEEQPPLLLHWDFNTAADDGRLVLDRSGQGRHGRFVGNAGKVHLTPSVDGFGQALVLNGAEEFIELAEPQWSRLDDSFDEFTVALWLKPAEHHHLEKMICGKMGFKYRRGWQLSLTPDNKPRFVFYRAPSDRERITLVAEKALRIGEFSHLAMTFKGLDAVRLYVNGELCGVLNDVPMRMNGANRMNLQVGNRGDGYPLHFFEGMIDDFRIYRVALTGTMIRRLFEPSPSGDVEKRTPPEPKSPQKSRQAKR
jgi:hypothetical protein